MLRKVAFMLNANWLRKTAAAAAVILSTGAVMAEPINIVVMRHGEARHNVERRFNSNPKNPGYFESFLTEKGKSIVAQSADRLASELRERKLKVSHIFASPLPRTQQTASIVREALGASELTIELDPRLIEVDIGKWEGRYFKDFPLDPWDHSKAHEAWIEGETNQDVDARLEKLLTQIRATPLPASACILLVTHGTPARELIKILAKRVEIRLPTADFHFLELR